MERPKLKVEEAGMNGGQGVPLRWAGPQVTSRAAGNANVRRFPVAPMVMRSLGLMGLLVGLVGSKCGSDSPSASPPLGLAGSGSLAGTVASGGAVAVSGGMTTVMPQPSGGAGVGGASTVVPVASGGGGLAGGSGQPPVIAFAEHLYVTDQTENAVYVYDIGPGATDAPSRWISGPNTRLGNPQSLVVDKQGALYVVNYRRDITVYAPGANGDVAPIFTFATDLHPLSITEPDSPTVIGEIADQPVDSPFYSPDAVHTEVFVLNDRHQTIPFALKARFDIRTLTGGWSWSPTGKYGCGATLNTWATCLQTPMLGPPVYCPSTDGQACLAEQGAGGRFSLADGGANAVRFRPDGKVVLARSNPERVGTYEINLLAGQTGTLLHNPAVITGAATGLTRPNSVAFDALNNMYVLNTGLGSYGGSVTVYRPDAIGDVSPIRTLGGRSFPFGMAVGP